MYCWIANCDDGSFEDRSSRMFATQKEAYEDMRNAALEKMKWNTEFDEDFDEIMPITYEVEFYPNKIIHKSYSGVYTYEMCVMRKLD